MMVLVGFLVGTAVITVIYCMVRIVRSGLKVHEPDELGPDPNAPKLFIRQDENAFVTWKWFVVSGPETRQDYGDRRPVSPWLKFSGSAYFRTTAKFAGMRRLRRVQRYAPPDYSHEVIQ